MKSRDILFRQYDKINWSNQEKTGINVLVNSYIIKEIIDENRKDVLKLFDIGFGIGLFMRMLYSSPNLSKKIIIEGCEPSQKNYQFFIKKSSKIPQGVKIKTVNSTFLETKIGDKNFDYITAIYVFPHFMQDELDDTVKKIHTILEHKGQFIMVVASEKYLEEKLQSMNDLLIERKAITYKGKKYTEVMHYSDIPEIGRVIDINREEKFYLELFGSNGFDLFSKKDLEDNGFICTTYVFQKR